ncbi:MAG: peptide/nickel transport system permease protein, partial [Gaiellaceae bacterium]|nr:peptide/nickel transport system permease protein [Gaiellaceae bacterium]
MSIAIEAVAEAAIVEHRRGFARRWYRTPSFVAGISILGVIVLLAIFAPLVAPSPTDQELLNQLQGPSWHHLLGTDDLGRDVWSRIVFGARTDLHIAFLAVLF